VGAVFVVALLATGAWSSFVDQVFLSKRQYVDVGFSYVSALKGRIADLRIGTAHSSLHSGVELIITASPLVIVPALALGWWRCRGAPDLPATGLVAFGAAGIVGVFPRPGVNHFTDAMPLVLAATASLWALVPRPGLAESRRARLFVVVAFTIAAAAALVVVGSATQDFVRGADLRAAPFAPAAFRGGGATPALRLRRALHTNTNGQVFIAREDAGYFYLMTGIRNPLPYDIAERSDFGSKGQQGVIDRIRRGEARWVCLYPPGSHTLRVDPLAPRMLERWVHRHLKLVAKAPACDLYRATAASRTGPRA
jgi:hypothetical protein